MKIRFDDRLIVEQFPEQRDWIGPMFRVVNGFFSQVGGALKGQLTFLDNFLGQEREFDFNYQSLALTFPQKFQWGLSVAPRALQVVSATKNGEPIMVAVAWEFTPEGAIQLTDAVQFASTATTVDPLTVGARYKIKVRVTP